MWLHVIYNDKKFVPRIMSLFDEAAPDKNVYAISGKGDHSVPAGTSAINNIGEFSKILHSRSDWEGIFFHPLYPECWKWISLIPRSIPVVWKLFGHEAYGFYPKLKRNLYLPETKKTLSSLYPMFFIKSEIKGLRDILTGRFKPLKRVDLIVLSMEDEFRLLKSAGFFSSDVKWMFGWVGALEDIVNCSSDKIDPPGPDIRVGHSANPSANHIEAFRWLTQFNLSDRKVVVPLSYGDTSYGSVILKEGHNILGDHFEPVVELLPLQQYNQMMTRCGFVVMNHLRQQGVNNIVADLWRGARVFMNNTVVFQAFKKMGLSVELMENQTERSFFTPKSKELILKDRDILQIHYGRKTMVEAIRAILEQCKNLHESRS